MPAKLAPIVDEEGGYTSGENEASELEVTEAESDVGILEQPLQDPFLNKYPEVTAAKIDVGILEQPCIPAPESLPADCPGRAVLNSVISLAKPTPMVEPSIVQDPFRNKCPEVTAAENDVRILEITAPTVEPYYEVVDNRICVESFAEDLLSVQHDLPLEEIDQEEGELLEFQNPTFDWLFR
ncbi:hypothetical protein Acr_11g0017590 [Actinidia rufa]|uniref:Uncharacterized protein n=1 Tax=Actinidia rufa TaxID=165716 RepID=A0A7J0FFR1_9ERIC|nr:hypothetical protein Acr_11g0017590 [Actinidia rufa]